jgi:hypothetical protein
VLRRLGGNFSKEILHFGKSGLGFLDILSLQFFSLGGQCTWEDNRTCDRRKREKVARVVRTRTGRTCEQYEKQVARVNRPHV